MSQHKVNLSDKEITRVCDLLDEQHDLVKKLSNKLNNILIKHLALIDNNRAKQPIGEW